MDRRQYLAVAAAGVTVVAGCSGDSESTPRDSDGDGVPDSEDYAPRDPDVQDEDDVAGGATATEVPTETATRTETGTETVTATETATPTETTTPTETATPTQTTTITATPTETTTATPRATETATATVTETATATPTQTTTTEEGPSSVSLGAQDATPEDSYTTFETGFNSQVQKTIDPDDVDGYYEASGKYLVVKLEITNAGDQDADLTPSFYNFLSEGGVEHSYQPLEGHPNDLSGVRLRAGGTFSGWTPYDIPEDVTSGDLVADQSAYYDSMAVQFEQDTSLEIDVPTV